MTSLSILLFCIQVRQIVRILPSLLVAVAVALFVRRILIEPLGPDLSDLLWRAGPGLAIYLGFGIYWEYAGRNASALSQSESSLSSAAHQLLIAIGLVLVIAPVPGLVLRFLPASYLLVAIGLIVELLGVSIAVWARRTLGTSWRREVAITDGHRLVREGPYERVRHPIYTGALLIYAGLAISVGQVHALLGVAVIALAYWRKIAMEEALLSKAYGADFAQYRRTSWSVVPYVF